MQTIAEARLLGSRSEGARRVELLQAEEDLAAARLEAWRRQHRTISDRGQPESALTPANLRRRAARKAKLIPVLGQREYRGGGFFTIIERSC